MNNAALEALAARLASVKSKAAAPRWPLPVPAAPDPALSAQIGSLEKSVAALRDELAAAAARSQQLAATRRRRQINAARGAAAAGPLADQ